MQAVVLLKTRKSLWKAAANAARGVVGRTRCTIQCGESYCCVPAQPQLRETRDDGWYISQKIDLEAIGALSSRLTGTIGSGAGENIGIRRRSGIKGFGHNETGYLYG